MTIENAALKKLKATRDWTNFVMDQLIEVFPDRWAQLAKVKAELNTSVDVIAADLNDKAS